MNQFTPITRIPSVIIPLERYPAGVNTTLYKGIGVVFHYTITYIYSL